jgi:hypothetical protein
MVVINEGAKVKILVGTHKDEIGIYRGMCCSRYIIELANHKGVDLNDASDFEAVKDVKPVKAKAVKKPAALKSDKPKTPKVKKPVHPIQKTVV